jgi:membrane-bound metal-dependent hydrolase YbcI (DUF457 family)
MLSGLHFLTHIGQSWLVAHLARLSARDRGLVVLAGTVLDLDGIGILWSESAYVATHRIVGHSLLAGLVVVAMAMLLAHTPRTTGLLAALAFHLHLVLDLVGTGGLPIRYFWPVSDHGFTYDGRWVLASWPNVAVMLLTLLGVIALARRRSAVRRAG